MKIHASYTTKNSATLLKERLRRRCYPPVAVSLAASIVNKLKLRFVKLPVPMWLFRKVLLIGWTRRNLCTEIFHFLWYETILDYLNIIITTKNTVITPNFIVWKFCGKAQFPHSFGRFARNYAETMPFHKISTPGN